MQQVLAVLFVLLCLWGAVLFLRKKGIAVSTRPFRKQQPYIQHLQGMRLTAQHSIHFLRIENRGFLIAVHPQGVTLLQEGFGGTAAPEVREGLG